MNETYNFNGSDVKVPGNGEYSRIIQSVLDTFNGTIGTQAGGTEDRAAGGVAASGPSLYLLENKGVKEEGYREWWTGKEIRSKDMCKRTIENAVERLGRYGVVVITLTDGGAVPDERVACDNWKNLWRDYFKRRNYTGFAKVVERGEESGKVHIHAVVGCPEGKKIGYDDKFGRFHSSKWCKEERAQFYKVCESYGFGRIEEFDKLRKTGKAIGCYFAKYITKGFENRRLKGARVWSCSRNWSIGAVSKTGSGTISGWLYRLKVGEFLKACGVQGEERAIELWGESWQWGMSRYIKAQKLLGEYTFPSARHALRARAYIPFAGKLSRDGKLYYEYEPGVREEIQFPLKARTMDYYVKLFEDDVARMKEDGHMIVAQPELFTLRESSPEKFACTGAEVP